MLSRRRSSTKSVQEDEGSCSIEVLLLEHRPGLKGYMLVLQDTASGENFMKFVTLGLTNHKLMPVTLLCNRLKQITPLTITLEQSYFFVFPSLLSCFCCDFDHSNIFCNILRIWHRYFTFST